MVNFSPLMAEIDSVVWGTPANFNRFSVLALLLQRRRSLESNQTLHDVWSYPRADTLHVAGRPSRWASAHIYSFSREISLGVVSVFFILKIIISSRLTKVLRISLKYS